MIFKGQVRYFTIKALF